MRLWSLHPSLLDDLSLLAFLKEALFAERLLNEDFSLLSYPELGRFYSHQYRNEIFSLYIEGVLRECKRRKLSFAPHDESKKIVASFSKKCLAFFDNGGDIPCEMRIPVSDGQLWFEYRKLLTILEKRDEILYALLLSFDDMCGLPPLHPIFRGIQGGVEKWDMDWYENVR